ncbi:MAG: hypothetical protein ABIT04_01680 [Novosphingobium sp.]
MAVEDFPGFAEWVASLDNLVEAKDRLMAAIRARAPEAELVAARHAVTLAQDRYEAAAYELLD